MYTWYNVRTFYDNDTHSKQKLDLSNKISFAARLIGY